MKQLLQFAIKTPRYLAYLGLTMLAMLTLTIATQMEVLTIGVLAQQGPDFFELFAPEKEGHLQKVNKITDLQIEQRLSALDPQGKGYVTRDDARQFLEGVKRTGLIDRVVQTLNQYFPVSGNLVNLAIMITIVGIFKALALFWQRYSVRIVAIRISTDLRQQYFEHIQRLPLDFYQQYNIGSLSSRVVTDSILIAEGLNAFLVNYLQTPFTIITTLMLCFSISWQLSLIVFFGFPAIFIPILMFARKIKRTTKQLQKNQEAFASVLVDYLAGIQTIKVFAMEDFSLKKYKTQNEKMAKLERKTARYDVMTRPVIHTIGMCFLATALLYGLYILQMDVADVLVYCFFLNVFYEPVKKFAEENSMIQKGAASAERLNEILTMQPKIQDEAGAIALNGLSKQIEFDNVWFKYNDEWVLRGLSFSVEKGKTVAIVGPTGAGKSTIVQLLPRLYDIQKGEIRIDGKPLTVYTQKSLRENISFVPQKPFLFLDTVAENMAFGRPFTRQQIEEAAQKAHAAEFIEKLPLKYDTELAETGKNLSGGQQQRLAIARALLKDAPILVMDEATSSLDAISEDAIKASIRQLHGKVTQIIIAHRLSTVEHADKIIFIERGVKIAEGSKEELLQSCPAFKQMWTLMNMSPPVQP